MSDDLDPAAVERALSSEWLSECAEDTISDPCSRLAVALRFDPESREPYPVCRRHVRDDMVPLAALAAARAGDDTERACRSCGHSLDEHNGPGGRCLAPFTACSCADPAPVPSSVDDLRAEVERIAAAVVSVTPCSCSAQRARAERAEAEVEEYDAVLTRQRDLLTRTVNALRGDPPPLTTWSHHDLPDLAAAALARADVLAREVADLRAALSLRDQQVAAVERLWHDFASRGPTHRHVTEAIAAALDAGSGEQPGEPCQARSPWGAACTYPEGHAGGHRPAPVVPDSTGLREHAEAAAVEVLEDDASEGLTTFDLGVKVAHAVLAVVRPDEQDRP